MDYDNSALYCIDLFMFIILLTMNTKEQSAKSHKTMGDILI